MPNIIKYTKTNVIFLSFFSYEFVPDIYIFLELEDLCIDLRSVNMEIIMSVLIVLCSNSFCS